MIKGRTSAGFTNKGRVAVHIFAWSIIVSTLLVKQHVLLDVAGAIALVEILWFGVGKLSIGHRAKTGELSSAGRICRSNESPDSTIAV